MSNPREERLIIALVICLALSAIIPNIFLLLFAGSDITWRVMGAIGFLVIAVVVGAFYKFFWAMVIALTRGPVAPATLMKMIHKELISDTSVVVKPRGSSVKAVIEAFHENERFILERFRYDTLKDQFLCPGGKTLRL